VARERGLKMHPAGIDQPPASLFPAISRPAEGPWIAAGIQWKLTILWLGTGRFPLRIEEDRRGTPESVFLPRIGGANPIDYEDQLFGSADPMVAADSLYGPSLWSPCIMTTAVGKVIRRASTGASIGAGNARPLDEMDRAILTFHSVLGSAAAEVIGEIKD